MSCALFPRLFLIPVVCALAACGLEAPARGEYLGGGPLGVAHARFEVRTRHVDLLPVDVFFPAEPDGTALRAEGGRPGLVFIQGGAVDAADYHWLARRLAARGHVVAVPDVRSKLALFSVDDGAAARELLVEPPAGSVLEGLVDAERLAVAGHSLGGVVAGKLALAGGFRALAIQASYTDGADDGRLGELDMPVLSLAGSADCSARPEALRKGFEKLPAPAAWVLLPGVTHFQFTVDDATDRARGCAAGTGLEAAHDAIERVMAAFLGEALGPARRPTVDGLSVVSGAEVEVR
jgi:pimeloyl-ACP methyl ester carboxylesterase